MHDLDLIDLSGPLADAILETTESPIVILSPDGSIARFNKASETLTGYSAAEAIGRKVWDFLIVDEEIDAVRGVFEQTFAADIPTHFTNYWKTKDARRRHLKWSNKTLLNKNGDVTNILATGIDITDIESTERRLSEVQFELLHMSRLSTLGEIATSIAHELNQPLTAAASLIGAVSLTLKKKSNGELCPQIELLDDAVDEIRRASEIMHQMRDFVRKHKTTRTPHDVNKIVEEASAIALIGADAQKIKVTTNLGNNIGEAPLDRIQIQQVVINLIRNAIDAMKESPERRLTISTQRNDGMIAIKVEDTGSGIPEELKTRLFEPFVTSKDDGLGVGLSISKSIIDAHQGEISATNLNSGGCIFTCKVPAGGHDQLDDNS